MSSIDDLNYKLLPQDQQELANLVGIDSYKDIIRTYGGTSLYIPKLETLEIIDRNAKIKAEFDGGNYKQLARKYHISEVWIRAILQQQKACNDG